MMHPIALIHWRGHWSVVGVGLIRPDPQTDPEPWWCTEDGRACCKLGDEDRIFSLSELEHEQ
jgi:hypothetical protein